MMNKSYEQGVCMLLQSFLVGERQAKQQQQCVVKVVKVSQIYSKQGLQKRLIQAMFRTFKKVSVKKESFYAACKRLLKIWDILLENQFTKNQHPYSTAISETIVESYTFIFPLIFQYRFHDLILDFKLYRMLWAKSITDTAFFSLRTEISKNHRNFDLSKGLNSEIDKIKKRFAQKGLTEEQIKKYLDTSQLQRRSDPSPSMEKRQHQRGSSEQDSDMMKKRLKLDQPSYPNPPSNQYNPLYPSNPYQNPYPIEQINPYQPRPNQLNIPQNYPSNNSSMYPPNMQRPYPNPYNNIPPHNMHSFPNLPTNQPYYSQPKPPKYPYNEYNNNAQSNYPPYIPQGNPNNYINPPIYSNPPYPPAPLLSIPPQANTYNNYPNSNAPNPNVASMRYTIPKNQPLVQLTGNPRDIRRQSPQFTTKMHQSTIEQQYFVPPEASDPTFRNEFKPTKPSQLTNKPERQKYRLLLNKLKKGLNECRQCGMNFISKQNLDEHKKQHFLEAHKKYLSKQSQTLGNSLGIQKQKLKSQDNFDMMCNVSEWTTGYSLQDQDGSADYQVSIKRLPASERVTPVFYCYFCCEDLEIVWCEQLQEWTLNKGIKVDDGDRGLSVAHIDCYECFKVEETSLNTSSSMSN